jgi:hypothetical protein
MEYFCVYTLKKVFKYLDNNNNNNNNIVQGFINICFSHILTITLKIMKKFLSTIALVLAISSVSMAKSSNKKSVVHRKKAQACVVIYCDGAGHIIGMVSNGGVIYGNINGCAC